METLSLWRHQMEAFSALLALCAGNSPVTGEFPSQRPVTRSFDVSLMLPWINGWVNNREAGDLRRNRAHYDVRVIFRVTGPLLGNPSVASPNEWSVVGIFGIFFVISWTSCWTNSQNYWFFFSAALMWHRCNVINFVMLQLILCT